APEIITVDKSLFNDPETVIQELHRALSAAEKLEQAFNRLFKARDGTGSKTRAEGRNRDDVRSRHTHGTGLDGIVPERLRESTRHHVLMGPQLLSVRYTDAGRDPQGRTPTIGTENISAATMAKF